MLPNLKIIEAGGNRYVLMQNNDIIGKELVNRGGFAEAEVKICRYFLEGKESAIVLDIGANIGTFTIPVAKSLYGMNGRIYSLEPQRVIFQQLCANVFFNQIDNCYAINAAVGETELLIEIPVIDFCSSTNPGGFTTSSEIRKNLEREYEMGTTAPNYFLTNKVENVKLITIDSLQLQGDVCFIKLDVEGNELECIKGASKTLEKNSFPPIIFEDWGEKFAWYREKSMQTHGILNTMGYQITLIAGRIYIAQHPEYARVISF